MSEKKTQIELPMNMLQGLLGGVQPAQKAPEVIEVMCTATRLCFNLDAIELVQEVLDPTMCLIRLKGLKRSVEIDVPYDVFLREINVTPRIIRNVQASSGG